jgi:hypothetical protein
MARLYCSFAFLFLTVIATAQYPKPNNPKSNLLSKEVVTNLKKELNPEYENWSPQEVVTRCAEHIAMVNVLDRCRIRYFDISDTPRKLHPQVLSSLFFMVNATTVVPVIATPQPVPNSDNRIFWIDVGWYGMDPQVWENIAKDDPFFKEPIVPTQDPARLFLLNATQSNSPVIRARWFLYYTSDNSQFLVAGQNKADDAYYYQLVYGIKPAVNEGPNKSSTAKPQKFVSKAPNTAKEFEEFFKVDFKVLKDFPIDVGGMINNGKSGPSFNARVTWRVRSPVGVYWRTFDVLRTEGEGDFVQSPFPNKFDAGEHIFQDARGNQFYLLSNGAGQRIEVGDPLVVRASPIGHPAVITPMGCFACHNVGILSFQNDHEILRNNGIKLFGKDFERAGRFQQFFLDPRLDMKIEEDQKWFRQFISDCNGLNAEVSARQLEEVRLHYAMNVSAEQAAREVGCTEQELLDALGLGLGTLENPTSTASGRLGDLAVTKTAVPRHTWDVELYQQAALLVQKRRELIKSGKIKQELNREK